MPFEGADPDDDRAAEGAALGGAPLPGAYGRALLGIGSTDDVAAAGAAVDAVAAGVAGAEAAPAAAPACAAPTGSPVAMAGAPAAAAAAAEVAGATAGAGDWLAEALESAPLLAVPPQKVHVLHLQNLKHAHQHTFRADAPDRRDGEGR